MNRSWLPALGARRLLVAVSIAATAAAQRPEIAPVALAASSIVVMPLDATLAAAVRKPVLLDNHALQRSARAFDFWGGAGVFIASGAAYAAGELGDQPRTRDFGVSTGKALLASGLATGTLKFAFGRARPFVSADTNPGDFGLWRGWRDEAYRSFPSGHATAAFAFASAATKEIARTDGAQARRAGAVLYTSAALVALTRMYQDKHWASDVLMGAAIGTAAGLILVR